MKNLFMIAIALLTLNATAQERKKGAQRGEMKEKMELRQNMTPEEVAELQTKKMTLHLDLNEKQQAEVNKLFIEEAKDRKEKMEEFKTKRDAANGEKPSKEVRLKMANERLDHQIEMKKKIKAILNADQYEKFDKMQEKREARKGHGKKMRKQKE